MPTIRAGRFRDKITVERIDTAAPTGIDGKVDLQDDSNWQTLLERHAEVMAVSMRERVYANQQVAAGTTRITMRADSQTNGITSRDRVKVACGVNAGVYHIDGVIGVGSPARLVELSCMRVT